MRRLILLAVGAFLLSCTIPFVATAADEQPQTTSVTAQPAKIGVVDMQQIATDSDPAKAAKELMESKYSKERTSLESRGKSLKSQAEALKNTKAKDIDKKRMDFLKAKQKLDNDTNAFLRKVEQDDIKIRQELVTMIFSATYEVAKANGYTFVVDINGGGVIYADKSMDLTKLVMAEVNRIYKENKDKKPAEPAQNTQGDK